MGYAECGQDMSRPNGAQTVGTANAVPIVFVERAERDNGIFWASGLSEVAQITVHLRTRLRQKRRIAIAG